MNRITKIVEMASPGNLNYPMILNYIMKQNKNVYISSLPVLSLSCQSQMPSYLSINQWRAQQISKRRYILTRRPPPTRNIEETGESGRRSLRYLLLPNLPLTFDDQLCVLLLLVKVKVAR